MLTGIEFYKELFKRCLNAKNSIWCGISFIEWNFKFPNGKYWWEVFQSIHTQTPSIKIRLLLWRNLDERWGENSCIKGSDLDLNAYIIKHALCKAMEFKWDESPTNSHCHHQKYFIIDGEQTDMNIVYGFIGGMTLNEFTYDELRHDSVIELQGDCCIDIIANFKLRWNCNNINTKKYMKCIEFCSQFNTDIIDNEQKMNINDWKTNVQICWTCYPGLYPTVDKEYGECGIHYQYVKQFENAKETIYIESQHPGEYHLLNILVNKLKTMPDLKVLYIVPILMMSPIWMAKQKALEYELNGGNKEPPRYYSLFSTLSLLGKYSNFCLCGLYVKRNPVYVHSKLCIVDGRWFTIGSANFVDISLISDHTEINACVFDEKESIKLMRKLAGKHCISSMGKNVNSNVNSLFDKMDHKQIVGHMMSLAVNNAEKYEENGYLEHTNGWLFKLDPVMYATKNLIVPYK